MKSLENIMKEVNSKIKMEENSGFILRKIYGPTRLHTDGIKENNDNKLTFINEQGKGDHFLIRTASAIFALNDDHEGGVFNFPCHDVKIKLKKGSCLLFPPYWTHPHEVSKLENDTYRYTLSTWFCENIN
jgi:hypothetical protein